MAISAIGISVGYFKYREAEAANCMVFLEDAVSIEYEILGSTADGFTFVVDKERDSEEFSTIISTLTDTEYGISIRQFKDGEGRGAKIVLFDQQGQRIGEIYTHTDLLIEVNGRVYLAKESIDLQAIGNVVEKRIYDKVHNEDGQLIADQLLRDD